MIKENNLIKPESGKYLRLGLNNTIYDSIYLGDNVILINNIPTSVNILESDIKEVFPIDLNGNKVFVESTTYGNLVTELIRTKYSLNEELALYANALNGNISELQDYLDWRSVCKQTAKAFINE